MRGARASSSPPTAPPISLIVSAQPWKTLTKNVPQAASQPELSAQTLSCFSLALWASAHIWEGAHKPRTLTCANHRMT